MPFARTLLALLAAAPIAPAQSGELKMVIDEGLAELARRQLPDGSYGPDPVTTSEALLAFAGSHRRYGEVDGPFMRRALEWLADQVGVDGRPIGVPELEAQVAAAGWMREALALGRGDECKAARDRVERFLASDEIAQRAAAMRDWDDFRREYRLPAEGADQARAALDPVTSVLCSTPQTRPEEWNRWLRAMPAICRDLAERFPELTLPTTEGSDRHWADLLAVVVVRATQAPAGFEEANPGQIAASVRALSVCMANERKGAGDSGGPAAPAGTPRIVGDDLGTAYHEAAAAALSWLDGQQKAGRFGFMGREDPGITALTLSAVLRTCRRLGRERPEFVDSGLDWIVSLQKANGSIHAGGLAVYVTSAAVMALADAARPQDRPVIERATLFLKVIQRDEAEGYDPRLDWGYGGIGYGNELRPDLSNTQFGLEALRAGGVAADDPAMQRAILFLERCQNHPESNPAEIERADGRVVVAGTDGGASYQPGDSKAGLVDRGDGTFVARSYGSMTYALLKCYLFAGLPIDDPRVQAAVKWIERNWTVDLNPGFDPQSSQGAEYQGLFYYYFTMAKALDASGLATLTAPDGEAHAWRDELLAKLLAISYEEGFWSNRKSARWMEELPVLATSYALVAMDHCLGGR
jgi:squalene-hopene/tetraprenyl-beta-curcumene cyclase